MSPLISQPPENVLRSKYSKIISNYVTLQKSHIRLQFAFYELPDGMADGGHIHQRDRRSIRGL